MRLREAAVRRCFSNKVFLKIWQDKPVLESLFNIAARLTAYNYIKKRPQHRRFPLNIA